MFVGVSVGAFVGVSVGVVVTAGVPVGVLVGVSVGVFVGVIVGVGVGVEETQGCCDWARASPEPLSPMVNTSPPSIDLT